MVMKRWIVCLMLFGIVFESLAMANGNLVFVGQGFAISLKNNKVEALVLPANPETASTFRNIENKIFEAWKEAKNIVIECPANFFLTPPAVDIPMRGDRYLMLYSIDISNCKEKKK